MTISTPLINEEFGIRPAMRADLLAIARIEHVSFSQPWPFNAFSQFLGKSGFMVAVDGEERILGYVVADMTSSYGKPIGHIKDIAVHPSHRKKGIASALLLRALSVLWANGGSSTRLEVRESNSTAITLYQSVGFETHNRIPKYYDDGEDALVMISDNS